jgi:cation transport ATPase
MQLVEDAQAPRSRAQALADRAAFILTLVAVGSARAAVCSSATRRAR